MPSAGRLRRDLPEPTNGIGLAKVERHDHLRDQVALLRTAQSPPQRHRDVDAHRRIVHRLAAALQQRTQAAGNGRQKDVVHRRVVGAADRLDRVEAAPDQREPRSGPTIRSRLVAVAGSSARSSRMAGHAARTWRSPVRASTDSELATARKRRARLSA